MGLSARADEEWPGLSPPAAAVAAAIVATSSEFWSEAADLWLDLALWRVTADEAWPLAAEAALSCGDFGLADQMIARGAASAIPTWLAPGIARAEPIRAERRTHFTSGAAAPLDRLLDLRLYRDAIRAVAAEPGLGEAATRGWLIRSHHGLGEHDVACEIGHGLVGAAGPAEQCLADSRARLEVRARTLAEHRDRFAEDHPGASIVAWLEG